jgi:hypothetical protein
VARRTKQAARSLPHDVIEGYERRLTSNAIPIAKLPEIVELRAIGRDLLAHIAALEERMEVAGR